MATEEKFGSRRTAEGAVDAAAAALLGTLLSAAAATAAATAAQPVAVPTVSRSGPASAAIARASRFLRATN